MLVGRVVFEESFVGICRRGMLTGVHQVVGYIKLVLPGKHTVFRYLHQFQVLH